MGKGGDGDGGGLIAGIGCFFVLIFTIILVVLIVQAVNLETGVAWTTCMADELGVRPASVPCTWSTSATCGLPPRFAHRWCGVDPARVSRPILIVIPTTFLLIFACCSKVSGKENVSPGPWELKCITTGCVPLMLAGAVYGFMVVMLVFGLIWMGVKSAVTAGNGFALTFCGIFGIWLVTSPTLDAAKGEHCRPCAAPSAGLG
jgi:hypothetical protein